MSYSGTLKVDNISNVAGTHTNTIDKAIDGTIAAWVNIGRNSTTFAVILQSHNVNGLTEIAVGNFQIDFPQGLLLEGVYYGITGGATESTVDGATGAYLFGAATDTKSAGYCQVSLIDRANALQSPLEFLVAVIQ